MQEQLKLLQRGRDATSANPRQKIFFNSQTQPTRVTELGVFDCGDGVVDKRSLAVARCHMDSLCVGRASGPGALCFADVVG
jgi:hypothetical protein